jgi:hypothetical protein
MHSGMPRWPKTWDFLTKTHAINTVLQISVNQLNANVNYLRVTPDNTPINGSSETSVINTMVKVMKSYGKIWGTSHYQIIVLQTNNPAKVDFQFKLAKALKKANSGLDIDAELSAEMCDIPMHLASTKTLYLVIRNSKGKKFKEGVNPYEDEQMSNDYSSMTSTPPDYIEKGSKVIMIDIPFGDSKVVPKHLIANKIPGVVINTYTTSGRWIYVVKFQNGTTFDCRRTDLQRVGINEAEKVEKICSNCRMNPPEKNRDRCEHCLKGGTQWVPKEKEKVDEAQIDEEDGAVMSSDFMDQLPAGKGGAGQTGDQINTQARKRLDAYSKEGFGAKIESVKTTESQIKVLQRKPNGFDIIDVIDRELGEFSMTSTKEIQYKDSSYKVIKHPKYKDCIVIA